MRKETQIDGPLTGELVFDLMFLFDEVIRNTQNSRQMGCQAG